MTFAIADVIPALADALAPFKLSSPLPELLASHDRVTAFEIAREHTRPPLYLDARLTRLFDTRGQLVSAVLMLRDVTDERRERQAQVDFFNLVSHKLRTPLTVLTGYMDVLRGLSPERWGSEAHRILLVCRDEVGRLNDTFLRMLQFKRQADQQRPAGSEASFVGPLLQSVAEDIRERYRGREVELRVLAEPDLAPLDIHPEQLRFALDQILDNAVKFGDKNPVRVAASARGLDTAVEVVVADNGPGIPHEYRDRVFEGFVQIEDIGTGEVPGLGVGLRLAREVITANGGSVALHSVIGQGTEVSVRLPVQAR
ncbi:MAG: HAMP domain-containing histidine kinase [Armatimonadetes bacterium]|nr:HAMP domain-containing histidine kinase [Armatimonadota bacterium]